MNESAQIAAVLIGLAFAIPVLVALRHTGAPDHAAGSSYATFHDGPAPLFLDCEGPCQGATAHEADGDGGATCITCGTSRPAAEPAEA